MVVATCSITLDIQIIVPEVHDLRKLPMISWKEIDEHTLPFSHFPYMIQRNIKNKKKDPLNIYLSNLLDLVLSRVLIKLSQLKSIRTSGLKSQFIFRNKKKCIQIDSDTGNIKFIELRKRK